MHWPLLAAGVLAAAAVLLELEILRRLGAIARRLDGVDLEVQTLRVHVRALGSTGGGGAGPATPPAAAPGR